MVGDRLNFIYKDMVASTGRGGNLDAAIRLLQAIAASGRNVRRFLPAKRPERPLGMDHHLRPAQQNQLGSRRRRRGHLSLAA